MQPPQNDYMVFVDEGVIDTPSLDHPPRRTWDSTDRNPGVSAGNGTAVESQWSKVVASFASFQRDVVGAETPIPVTG